MIIKTWAGWCGGCLNILDMPDAKYKFECVKALVEQGWKRYEKRGWLCADCVAKLAQKAHE